jgi:pilus assembly protein Flp/PilA
MADVRTIARAFIGRATARQTTAMQWPEKRRTIMSTFKQHARIKQLLSAFVQDESGQDLIEYALVAAIIALGATAAMTSLAGTISSAFSKIGTSLSSAV